MTEYVIAKYIRLSMDDAITESLSISNQQLQLDRQIDEMDIAGAQVLEFIDNGYSGTNFERPAVQEMLELVQSGKIDCILCKDFSRFGRNAIETGFFIEQVFPLYQVRFIAVGDSFDSDNYLGDTGGIDVAFKFLMHEYYSKDLSQKVKSAKHIKMRNGESITANAIYGYYKGKSGTLEIDEEAALVVRRIYRLALEGLSTAEIRDRIFADNIPTPREYSSIKKGADMLPSYMWTARMVLHILSNEQYTGMYVSGKQVSKAIGSHSKNWIDKKHWIMIPDWHPPIISKEVFQEVQEKLQKYRRSKRVCKPREYLLRGKVACGCCQYALAYDAIDDPVFRCHHTQADSSAECHKMKVNVHELDEMVLSIIQKQVEVVLNQSDLSKFQKAGVSTHQISDYESLIKECLEQRQQVYEDYVESLIDHETYLSLKNTCSTRHDKLSQQLSLLKSAQTAVHSREKTYALVEKVMKESASDREMVEVFVKKIYAFPGNRVEIDWLIADFTLLAEGGAV